MVESGFGLTIKVKIQLKLQYFLAIIKGQSDNIISK